MGWTWFYLQRTHGDFVYMNDPVGARRPIGKPRPPVGHASPHTMKPTLRSYEGPEAARAKIMARNGSKYSKALDDYREFGLHSEHRRYA